MILDDYQPWVIILDAEGNETGNILPWSANAISIAWKLNGYALRINGDEDDPFCDFRLLSGRVWTSQAGQEMRVFMSDHGIWQYSVAGMDISDGAVHHSQAEAAESARSVDEHYGWVPWADCPLWADLLDSNVR